MFDEDELDITFEYTITDKLMDAYRPLYRDRTENPRMKKHACEDEDDSYLPSDDESGKMNQPRFPEGLDLLCELIIYGALKLSSFRYGEKQERMPDYREVIEQVYGNDPLVKDVSMQYLDQFGESFWNPVWRQCEDEADVILKRILEKFRALNEPEVSFADGLIPYKAGCSTLCITDHMILPPSYMKGNENCFVSENELEVCIAGMIMMRRGGGLKQIRVGNPYECDFGGMKFNRVICCKIPSSAVEKEYSGWQNAVKICSLLSKEGQAAVIMPARVLDDEEHREVRKELLTKGMIEGIVKLPEEEVWYGGIDNAAENHTEVPLCAVLLSSGNRDVKAVDLTSFMKSDPKAFYHINLFVRERKDINTLPAADMVHDVIQSQYALEEAFYGRILTEEELEAADWNLNPLHYIQDDPMVSSSVDLREVTRITESMESCTMPDIHITKEDTGYYLLCSHFDESVTGHSLLKIEDPENSFKDNCLKKGMLVIENDGLPGTVGIAEIGEDERILVLHHRILIEADETRIDPYYLAAYFNSERGRRALENLYRRNILDGLSEIELKYLPVPCPPLEMQKETADRYREVLKQLRIQKDKEYKIRESMRNLF